MKEIKVGEVITLEDGRKAKCVKDDNKEWVNNCEYCVFQTECSLVMSPTEQLEQLPVCISDLREDKNSVHFVLTF